jgi:hypothetical protein
MPLAKCFRFRSHAYGQRQSERAGNVSGRDQVRCEHLEHSFASDEPVRLKKCDD